MNATTDSLNVTRDAELIRQAQQKDVYAIRLITSRYNQQLFRVAWSVLQNHADAEDVLQESYLKAFTALKSFSGQSSLSTWLTRIVLNTALDTIRATNRRQSALNEQDVVLMDVYRSHYTSSSNSEQPDRHLMKSEFAKILKAALGRLPEQYRTTFILREIEGLTVTEAANILSINEATVKTRLFRARRLLKQALEPEFGDIFKSTLPFAGSECEAMTSRVLKALITDPKGETINDKP